MFSFIDMIIVRPIANILFIIYNFVGDFGLAIILFTILVKLLTWPLTKKQLHQTKLMKKLQPELAQIKKNCNGNRQLESLQTMDLYKRYNVKPFGSILTLLIQIPIFIALYTAIRVMVLPTATENLSIRAYGFVQQMDKIDEVISLQAPVIADASASYDFQPQLFGLVNLYNKPGFTSISAIIMLIFALGAAFIQYYITRQQTPSGKSEKNKKFRDLLQDAADGKDVNQAEMSVVMTRQMSLMMPIMLLLVMINLPGALVFYYFLSNAIALVQQTIILKSSFFEMDNVADKAILKELKNAQEAEIIENKKTGTKTKIISKKDSKKKRS